MLNGIDRERIWLRFEERRSHNHETGCLLWTGAKFSNGWPRLTVKGKQIDARRVHFFLLTGKVLDADLTLSPSCGDDLCLQPEHIEVRGDWISLDRLRS